MKVSKVKVTRPKEIHLNINETNYVQSHHVSSNIHFILMAHMACWLLFERKLPLHHLSLHWCGKTEKKNKKWYSITSWRPFSLSSTYPLFCQICLLLSSNAQSKCVSKNLLSQTKSITNNSQTYDEWQPQLAMVLTLEWGWPYQDVSNDNCWYVVIFPVFIPSVYPNPK